ncbi:MAG: DUF4129 domain-containing protein [Streptosporangiaceae bacterium]|nr:DUF4129 domain-containing protein [Streptosporangiaceae bacterium]
MSYHGAARGGGLRSWAGRVVLVALLMVLALAGLRGAVATPRWNGPLHSSGIAIGVLLVAVLAALLTITVIRSRSARNQLGEADLGLGSLAAKLRTVLEFVLSGGIVACLITMLIALHLHLFSIKPKRVKAVSGAPRQVNPFLGRSQIPSTGKSVIPLNDILYGLLVLALIIAVLVAARWSYRLRPATKPGDINEETEDSEDLREAVESGRAALRTLDDARAAIIACYLAMEQRLAERGTARGVAGTPDELLARAIRNGIVRGTAASRLTALFYEARFSSHPMDQAQRQAAERALDELAADLATRPQPAGPGTAGSGAAGSGAATAEAAGAGA